MSTSTMMSFIQPPLQLKPTFQEVQNWPTVRLDVELLEYKCVNAVVWDCTVSKHEKMVVDIDHFLDKVLVL